MLDADECPRCGARMHPVLTREPAPVDDTDPGPLLADPQVLLVCSDCGPVRP